MKSSFNAVIVWDEERKDDFPSSPMSLAEHLEKLGINAAFPGYNNAPFIISLKISDVIYKKENP